MNRQKYAANNWGVGYETGSGFDGAILKVYKMRRRRDGRIFFQYGDHHRKQFSNIDSAQQFAISKGYLELYSTPAFVKNMARNRFRERFGSAALPKAHRHKFID